MLEGVAIIDRSQPGEPVTYSAGVAGIDTIETGRSLLAANPGEPSHGRGADARAVLACPWSIPPSRLGGLVLWRTPGAPDGGKPIIRWPRQRPCCCVISSAPGSARSVSTH